MLASLFIQNYAIIESLEISFQDHFSILTGETGAGKSIIFGAISLIIGERADSKALYNPTEKCIIEGIFEIKNHRAIQALFEEKDWDFDEECIIRREISPNGKSRAFVNDTPVLLEELKQLGELLVDIHAQQDHWWLSQPDYVLAILDEYAENQSALKEYQSIYDLYQEVAEKLILLRNKKTLEDNQFDFKSFQLNELVEAKLDEKEYEELSLEMGKLSHAELILEKLSQIHQSISGEENSSLTLIKTALAHIQSIAKMNPDYQDWNQRIESIWIEIKEISREIDSELTNFSLDPQRLAFVEERLDVYRKLLQKHKTNSISELIQLQNQLENELDQLGNIDKQLADLENQAARLKEDILVKGQHLSNNRKSVSQEIIGSLSQTLIDLGMPNAVLDWEWQEKEAGKKGLDKVQLVFSSNKGSSLKPLKAIASGGEMSRIMLGIKYLMADKVKMPTLLLDEIDTGVSGEIAIKMGNMLAKMAKSHQIIAITHLPQIAAGGESHYYVYKNTVEDRTISAIKRLNSEEQLHEIAKMIGGEENFEKLIPSVKELRKQIQLNNA